MSKQAELRAVEEFLAEGHTLVFMVSVGVEGPSPVMRVAMPPEIRQLDDWLWGFWWEQMGKAAEKVRTTPLDDLSWAGPHC